MDSHYFSILEQTQFPPFPPINVQADKRTRDVKQKSFTLSKNLEQMSNLKKETNTSKTGLRVAVAALALLLMGAVGGLFHYSNQSDAFANETIQLESKLTDLTGVQAELEAEVNELTATYDAETIKNTELEAKIADAEVKIKGLKGRILKIKRQLSEAQLSNEEMQTQIAELNTLKNDMVTQIAALESDKAELTTAKGLLGEQLGVANDQNDQLVAQVESLTDTNEKMQKRLFTLAPAGFQATGFQVQVAKRKNKLTSVARQAKEIKVDFNLADIPVDLQKEHEIYLVVTDGEGVPVQKIASTSMNVPTTNGELKVEVADMETIALTANQKMSMAFQPTDKMDAGLYNVALWSDAGYLGSTAFSLR